MLATKTFCRQLLLACNRDRLPLSICTVFLAIIIGLLRMKGINGFHFVSILLNVSLFLTCIFFVLAISFLWSLFRERPESPIASAMNFLSQKLKLSTIAYHLPILTALGVFMPIFSAMKGSISRFANYSWDSTFIAWDKLIHGGDAWLLVQPILGYPIATYLISNVYNLWIIIIYAATLFLALRNSDSKLRLRFLTSYFLCWFIIGVVLAISLASVGPAFLEPILGQDHFRPLVQYLRDANDAHRILSVEIQAKLVEQYQKNSTELGAGITAMPSMHNSMAFLYFLAMRHISRLATWLFGIFAFCILIGSVHLGYHYAVDGYLAIIVTALIWRATRYLRHSES